MMKNVLLSVLLFCLSQNLFAIDESDKAYLDGDVVVERAQRRGDACVAVFGDGEKYVSYLFS